MTGTTKSRMRTRTKVLATVAGIAIAGGMTVAVAKGVAGSRGHHWGHHGMHAQGIEMFERADADGDGKLTGAEATAFLDGVRAANDADGNGTINLAEFEGIVLEQARPLIAKRFDKLDDNGDGELSDAEIADRVARLMDRVDRNDDGAVDLREIKRKRRGWRHHHDDDDDDEYRS